LFPNTTSPHNPNLNLKALNQKLASQTDQINTAMFEGANTFQEANLTNGLLSAV